MDKLIVIAIILIVLLSFFYYKSNFTSESSIVKILKAMYLKFENKFEPNDTYENLGVVDRVYCIVMPQRKEYMKGVLGSMKINYTFFNAITPKDLSQIDYNILSTTNDPKSKLWKHPTRLPLQLSFTMCYLDAIKKGYKTIIVFEDDITVKVDIPTLMDSISTFKMSKYVFFYMGYCWMNCKQTFTIDKLVNVPDKQLFCCHSVCYKVKYLPELIKSMYPMKDNLDNNIVDFIKKNNLPVCVPTTTFFDQNRNDLGTLNDDDNEGALPDCNKELNKKTD